MDAPTPRLPRLTTGLLMRLIACFAVGLGIVVPMSRIPRYAGVSIAFPLLSCVVAVPLAWSRLSFLLFWRGPARDRLVVGFLLATVIAVLAICVGIPVVALRVVGPSAFEDATAETLASGPTFFLMLTASAWFLGRRLVRRRGKIES
jgi:hypothetical protein